MVNDFQSLDATMTPEIGADVGAPIGPALADARRQVDEVRTIAEALDRVFLIIEEIGPATLLAEVHDAPPKLVRNALDELVAAGNRALITLYGCARERRPPNDPDFARFG
jgi:hypothetical protein